MTVLITGGAGFIGSHMVRYLRERGVDIAVIDNLSSGHREVIPTSVPFLHADIEDRSAVTAFIRSQRVTAVMHFAALIEVGESVRHPQKYFDGNVRKTLVFLDSVLEAHVRTFVFSSTAAVYGMPRTPLIDESHPMEPLNPYGETKRIIERALDVYSKAYGLRYASLRYFNAAGAASDASLGERHPHESHLIPLVLDAALGRRPSINIYGSDYETPDGTCVRDYIHVEDLAEAHDAALRYLECGGESGAFNLGTGEGHSVRRVIEEVARLSGRKINVELGPRRPGDPAQLVANPKKAKDVFGFCPSRSSLERIVLDAWHFHRAAFSHTQTGTPHELQC